MDYGRQAGLRLNFDWHRLLNSSFKLCLVYLGVNILRGNLVCVLMHLKFDRLACFRVLCLHDIKLIERAVDVGHGYRSWGPRHAVLWQECVRNISCCVWRLLHLLSHLLFYWNIDRRLIFHVLSRINY